MFLFIFYLDEFNSTNMQKMFGGVLQKDNGRHVLGKSVGTGDKYITFREAIKTNINVKCDVRTILFYP